MTRTQARIHTLCWSDDAFLDLMWRSQHAYFLILSQPQVSFCGVCPLDTKRWALLCGDHRGNEMGRAVAELERKKFLVIDRDTNELLIRTFIKWDGILASPNLIVAMTRDFGLVVSPLLRRSILDELGEGFLEGLPEGLPKRLAKPFLKPFTERFAPHARACAEPLPLSNNSPPDERTLPGSPGAPDGANTPLTPPGEPADAIQAETVRELARNLRMKP